MEALAKHQLLNKNCFAELYFLTIPNQYTNNMTDRRPDSPEMPRAKRPKTEGSDPASNPYLAHMYEESNDSNGYLGDSSNGYSNTSALDGFKRHATTAEQAHAAEDGPNNPFNGQPLSTQYFNILKTRRDLPVHKQR